MHLNANNTVTGHNSVSLRALRRFGQRLQCNVLCFNYRGIGDSGGTVTQSGDLIEDAEAALSVLTNRGILPKHIVLHGHSIGGAVAALVGARQQYPSVLILDRTFASLGAVISAHGVGGIGVAAGIVFAGVSYGGRLALSDSLCCSQLFA